MNPSNPLDPLFLALAQPVLRGPAGRALTVVPRAGRGVGGVPIATRPWPPDDRGGTVRAWAHAEPHEPLPWVATQRRILALIDGHRRLAIAPAVPWGHDGAPPDAPYPAAVSARVGGLAVFFVNAVRQVRVFAADGAQAVELAPVDDAQIYAAWEAAGQLWAAGMVPRPQDADGDVAGFGQALLMRWNTRPLALDARWQGRDRWTVDASAMPAAEWADVLGVESWLAELPGPAGSRWLLGAPLMRGVHDLPADASPFWALGLPAPDDYGDLLLARIDDTAAHATLASAPPLTLTRLWSGHSLVGRCRAGAHASDALLFTLAQDGAGAARPGQLYVSHWSGATAALGAPQPLRINGLPQHAAQGLLRDFDALHHPDFGYAAALVWQTVGAGGGEAGHALTGALLHSSDGRHWQVAELLAEARA